MRIRWADAVTIVLAGTIWQMHVHADARDCPNANVVPIQVTPSRLVVVPVALDGIEPRPFLLDTGATATVVDAQLVEQLGLATVALRLEVTPNEARRMPVVRLPRLGIGSASFDGILATARRVEPLVNSGARIAGILGQDVLGQIDWSLDYDRRVIWIEDGCEPPRGLRLPIELADERPLITASLASGTSIRLVLDSGATVPILFRALDVTASVGDLMLETALKMARVDVVALPTLHVGARRLDRLRAARVTSPEPRVEEGLLPTSLFTRIRFENSRKQVVLW
jgi:hypothetical protein